MVKITSRAVWEWSKVYDKTRRFGRETSNTNARCYTLGPVSYTHLDVYKRQGRDHHNYLPEFSFVETVADNE